MGARRVSEPSVRNWAPVQATGNKRFLTAVVAASVAPCLALPSSLLRTSLLYALFQSQVWRGCWESAQTTNNASEGGSRVAGRRFWQRQCNGRARGIGSVSYVFWGAYETLKRRGAEREGGRQVEVRSEGTSRARWLDSSRPSAGGANLCLGA